MMGDTGNTSKPKKKSYWDGLKAEFHKIIWPDRDTVVSETSSVVAASIALGLIIAGLDTLIVWALHFAI